MRSRCWADKQCVAASRAFAEHKGAGGLIPDQSILINAIPLQEAKLSSDIENIVTTQDDLFRAAVEESVVADPNTKEVSPVPFQNTQFDRMR